MRFAYADPPYLGQGRRHYSDHPDHALYDTVAGHRELIDCLVAEFPDGWAMSASTPSLRALLPLCPPETRVAAWVKTFCAFKRGVRPAYAWEPVLFFGGRNPPRVPHPPPVKGGKQTTPKDFFAGPITLQKGLTGAKSEKFCAWVLDLLNFQPGDVLVDLFPGTGAMTLAAEATPEPRVEEPRPPEGDYLSPREQRRLMCSCGCRLRDHSEYGCSSHGRHAFTRTARP